MMTAIVTGANGFVGSAVCRELADRGINVIAVVRNEKSNLKSILDINGIDIRFCSMDDYANLPNLISDKVDILFHFAWEGSAGSLRSDESVQINNVIHTCSLVRACKEIGCNRFVFAASIMEYEIEALMKEKATPSSSTLYSTAKMTADYMARTIAGSNGLDYIRGVISNIYGIGEYSPRLINVSIRKMLKGEKCSFSPGNQMYDFIYISDAAKAFVEIGIKGKTNKTYYIGSLQPRPLKEFLLDLRDQINPNLEIGLGDFLFNGVSLSYKEFDVKAVKNDTGFVPEVGFKEGIYKTVLWIKEQENI